MMRCVLATIEPLTCCETCQQDPCECALYASREECHGDRHPCFGDYDSFYRGREWMRR